MSDISDIKTWDGMSPLRAGHRCEIQGTSSGLWAIGIIDYIDTRHCVWHWEAPPQNTIHNRTDLMKFRRVHTREDLAAAEIDRILHSVKPGEFSRVLYRAIKNGRITGVTLEEE